MKVAVFAAEASNAATRGTDDARLCSRRLCFSDNHIAVARREDESPIIQPDGVRCCGPILPAWFTPPDTIHGAREPPTAHFAFNACAHGEARFPLCVRIVHRLDGHAGVPYLAMTPSCKLYPNSVVPLVASHNIPFPSKVALGMCAPLHAASAIVVRAWAGWAGVKPILQVSGVRQDADTVKQFRRLTQRDFAQARVGLKNLRCSGRVVVVPPQ